MTEPYEQSRGGEKNAYQTARDNAAQACSAEVNGIRDSHQVKSATRPEVKGECLTIPPLHELSKPSGEQQKHTDLKAEETRLNTLVDTTGGVDTAKFKADMKAFEHRAKAEGLNPEAVAGTLSQVSRILEAKGDQPVKETDRVRAAMDIMAIAADPTSNPQGGHNTCNVTTMENRLFAKHPDVAAGLIADVATTGSYVANDKDHTKVSLDKDSLTMHDEERDSPNHPDKNRNYASQLFQVTAINLLYERDNKKNHTNEHYVQGNEIHTAAVNSSGEKVTDGSGKESTDTFGQHGEKPQKGGTLQDVVDMNTMITGKDESQAFLQRSDMVNPHEVDPDKDDTSKPRGKLAASKEEFKKQLELLNKTGQFPAVVSVNIANDPFNSIMQDARRKERSEHPDTDPAHQPPDTLVDTSTLQQDGHFVLITGYNPDTQEVTYKNPEGGDQNPKAPVKVDDFYKGMASAPADVWLDRLDKAREQAIEQGKFKEDVYARNLADIMTEYTLRWKFHEKGEADPGDEGIARGRYDKALQSMSVDNRQMTIDLVEKQVADRLKQMQPPDGQQD